MTPHPRRHSIPWILFAGLLGLDVLVLLLEKMAALQAGGLGGSFYGHVVRQPWMWSGLALGPAQLWVWTQILARMPLGQAYALSSLSYPVTMIAGWVVFGERLSLLVWLGAALITLGVAIIGKASTTRMTGQPPGSS